MYLAGAAMVFTSIHVGEHIGTSAHVHMHTWLYTCALCMLNLV